MAEKAIERPEENAELQSLNHDLSQELALRDSLVFKIEKLRAGENRFAAEKTESLRGDYQAIVDEINATSSQNMAKEIDAMGTFSRAIDEFNANCGDFLIEFTRLSAYVGEDK